MEVVESSLCTVTKNVRSFFLDTVAGKVVLGVGLAFVACKVAGNVKRRKMKAQWKAQSKDKVILHQFMRGKLSPNISPFCLKLETYLRMANIPYEVDFKDIWGPKRKTPYITVDGEEVADSEICIQFLSKKYGKDMTRNLSAEQRAVGHALQVMVDEHLYWGLLMWRYALNPHTFDAIQKLPFHFSFIMKILAPRMVKKAIYLQGTGRHSPSEIEEIMTKDLETISTILGTKKFLFGDEPCKYDCDVFGELAQIVWNTPGSNYAKLCDNKLTNLRDYCFRMKEHFWKDWDQCLVN